MSTNVYHSNIVINTSPTLLPNNPSYPFRVVFNRDVWIGGSTVAVGSGLLVAAGREIDLDPGSWYAVSIAPAEADIVEFRIGVYNYPSTVDLNALSSGQSTMSRDFISTSTAQISQRMLLSYFTSRKTETVGNLAVCVGSVAAGATPTLCKMGLYEIASNGNGTLVGSTPNDTALFNSTNSRHTKVVSTPFRITTGKRYAMALLVVSTAAMPNFQGTNNALGVILGVAPRMSGQISGLADLPATFLGTAPGDIAQRFYGEVLP